MLAVHTFRLHFIDISIFHFTQGQATSSSQSGESLPGNFIGFDSAPDKVVDGTVVRVRYRCSRRCQLAVEVVVVSTLKKTDLVVFRRKWISSAARVYRFQQVRLSFPPSIFSKHSLFNKRIAEAENVTLRAWLDHLHDGSGAGTYHGSIVRIYKVLQIMPLSKRPTKPPTECISWSTRLMWQMTRNGIHQCPHEPDVIDMLKFPLASTGEHFGLVRRFQPFIDRALERARLHAVTQPSVTVSVWIYLLKWCHKNLCGIIHHVDGKNLYDSVLMQLTDTGDVIIQTRVTTGEDEAFRAGVVLPLWKWIRLDCYIQDSKVRLNVTWDEKTRIYAYKFQDSVHYDDTDGYFVIGGGKYMPGIHGYFGPIRYYRFGTDEGHIYSLIGASGDNRFALMHAGYKHTQGIDGFPKDVDMAYSYYSNVGAQSSTDSSKQYTPEHIYLSNREDLNTLRDQTSDVFEYVKFRAAEGDVKFQGSVDALNGLGWYHDSILKDHKTAMKYFKQAALNGSDDGMFNLGIYHLNGKNPDSPWRNETAAFQQFLNASRFGHVAAAVEAAWYLSTGNLEGVSQDAERAVIMLKKVCEQNGHLGFMIREALQAYLQGSRQEAFVKYVLAAETGLGLAQSNIAHLCEELNLSYDCQWRYHNYSILNYAPHPSALLKMGDHYYYSSSTRKEDSLFLVGRAISMYSRAALAGSPQGMYNLVILAQRGYVLPLRVLSLFNVTRHDETEIQVEKILKRCVEIEDEDAVTPCSLALLGVQMGKALRKMSQNGAQLLLAYASLLSVFVIIVIVPLQICLGQRDSSCRVIELRSRTSSVIRGDGVNLNRVQDGITGGTYRAAGNLWLTTLNGERWLRQAGDLAVTLSGVCLCALWTTLLYHLL
ncbi:hypothetical protein PAMA_001729 [Pampus argenteus]